MIPFIEDGIQIFRTGQVSNFGIMNLSDKQFELFIQRNRNIQELKGESLKQFILRLKPEHYGFLNSLTKDQLQEIDFSNEGLIDQAKFEAMFEKFYSSIETDLSINDLTPSQVLDCLKRQLFTKAVANDIDCDHIEGIHFDQLVISQEEDKKQALKTFMTQIFSSGKISAVKYGLANVIPLVGPSAISELTEEQLKTLNMDAFKGLKNLFLGFQDPSNSLGIYTITFLSPSQIVQAFNLGLFTESIARHLTTNQIKEIDFSQIIIPDNATEKADLKKAINGIFKDSNAKENFDPEKLSSIEKGLNHIILLIEPEVVACLDDKQVGELDVSALSQGHVLSLSKVGKLSLAQTIKALEVGLFTATSAPYITDEYIENIDFEQSKVLEQKDVIRGLFTNDPKKISSVKKGLTNILQIVEPEVLAYLNEDQIARLNMGSLNHQDFSVLPEALIGKLSPEQLVEALNFGLFTTDAASSITSEQIEKIDFDLEALKQDDKKAAALGTVIHAIFEEQPKKISSVKRGLEKILPWIDPATVDLLEEDQVKKLNISILGANFSKLKGKQGKSIKGLSPEQVVEALNLGLFTTTAASSITSEQIEKIDFDLEAIKQDDRKEALGKVINAIFEKEPNKVSSVKNGLDKIIPFVPVNALAYLSEKQTKNLDVSLLDERQFAQLVNEVNYSRPIKFLDAKQILVAFNRGLFTERFSIFTPQNSKVYWLTDEQIGQIEWQKIEVPAEETQRELLKKVINIQKFKTIWSKKQEELQPPKELR